MRILSAIVVKETRLILRDIHGLLLLFVMPLIFITVMSLAMQDDFASRAGAKIDILLHDELADELSKQLLGAISNNSAFELRALNGEAFERKRELVERGDYPFLLHLDKNLSHMFDVNLSVDMSTLDGGFSDGQIDDPVADFQVDKTMPEAGITLWASPSANKQLVSMLSAVVAQSVTSIGVERGFQKIGFGQSNRAEIDSIKQRLAGDRALVVHHLYRSGEGGEAPTSVQQSVPAWLVFSLFFMVVPLSGTFIQERQQGTISRMNSMNVSPLLFIIGKLTPYLLVAQVQIALMLLVGRYLVPALGGAALTIERNVGVLFFVGLAISIAALGYAMVIAVIARTTEQATTLGGAGNIILAAIGGIMVPAFVMPPMMQVLAKWSPMNWGLSGFHDILLRGGGIADVLPEFALLSGFGVCLLAISAGLFYLSKES